MPFFRNKVIWSPVELQYLKDNRSIVINQLSVALAKSRNAVKNKLLELDGKKLPSKSSKKRTNIGKRQDLGIFLRSNWEANVCRYLKSLGISYEYEPQVFVFSKVKHGTVSYCPDIKLEDGTWIEVKGYLDSKSKTAIRRFKQYYPTEFARLKVVVGSENIKSDLFFKELGVSVFAYYNELCKKYKTIIPNWE